LVQLTACTGQWVIDQDANAYRSSFARASDEQVLQNILRARDNLPLHFAELNTLSSALQQSATVSASLPFSHRNGSTARDMLNPSVTLANNPQLSMGTLETQDFTRGLLSPVDAKLIQQFLDRGIDPRVILFLFFSGVKSTDGHQYTNTFRCRDLYNKVCTDDLFKYLEFIDRMYDRNIQRGRLHLHTYTILTPLGPPVSAVDKDKKPQLLPKDVAGIDPTKFTLRKISAEGGGMYQLYKISDSHIALCVENRATKQVVSAFSNRPSLACSNDSVIGSTAQIHAEKFEIRSVYQIVEYLGQVLQLQDADASDNRCIVLDREPDRRSCLHDDVLFQINSTRGAPVITTNFNNATFSVSDPACFGAACDHSTEVLGILTLLLNTNKIAKDIPSPTIVQVIQ
jgi:hypothetical protein